MLVNTQFNCLLIDKILLGFMLKFLDYCEKKYTLTIALYQLFSLLFILKTFCYFRKSEIFMYLRKYFNTYLTCKNV